MGTSTVYRGLLEIEPPLTWPEIQQTEAWERHPDHCPDSFAQRYGTRLVVDEEATDTPDGVLIRRTASAVEIVGDELRHNEVMHQLHQLAARFGDRHRFVGHLECHHDHPDETTGFRMRIVGNVAQEVWPVLFWPGDERAEEIVADILSRCADGEVGECVKLAKRVLQGLADGLNRK